MDFALSAPLQYDRAFTVTKTNTINQLARTGEQRRALNASKDLGDLYNVLQEDFWWVHGPVLQRTHTLTSWV